MKSWMSVRRPACAPPPNICTCGVGSSAASGPPRYWYSGTPCAAAAAWAAAIDTASVALAPSLDLLGVPSSSIRRSSSAAWSLAAMPITARAMSPLTCATARCTSRPPCGWPPSRSSSASRVPLLAPAGTIARPTAPPTSRTSASTVGWPRLSHTRRACTKRISLGFRRLLIDQPVAGARPRRPRSGGPADHAACRRRRGARTAAGLAW